MLALLQRRSPATLAEMQQATGSSPVTVRRDLNELEAQGLVHRVRGGAVLHASPSPLDEAFALRQHRDAAAKAAIAAAAADLVHEHSFVLLGDGTTTYALADELVRRAKPLMIATSAINIAARLAEVDHLEVLVLGGLLRGASYGTVGPLATAALGTLRADIAFISPDSLHPDGPVFNSFADAEVTRLMMARASRRVVLAHSGKFLRGGAAQLMRWEEIDDLVTETVPDRLAEHLAEGKVRVRRALAIR